MVKVVLFCAVGMSTSLLVNRMKEAAQKEGLDWEIEAHSISKAQQEGTGADIILLGPQVRHQLEAIKGQCPGVPVIVIDMVAYGTLDGKKVIAQVKDTLGVQ